MDQLDRVKVPVKVHVRYHFYFTKYLVENLENTRDDKKCLWTSFEWKFCNNVYI